MSADGSLARHLIGMAGEASPSSSKGAGEPYHRKQPSYGSLGDDGYSEGGSFSGRDSYMDEKEAGMRGFDYEPVRVQSFPSWQGASMYRRAALTGVVPESEQLGHKMAMLALEELVSRGHIS